MMKFETLPGFRTFYPEHCAVRNYLFNQWRTVAQLFNFQEYDAPTLEPLELYVEKSGDEIVSQLFNFTDRGEREVALRPEMTPSLARLVGSKANSLKRPIKWFSIGEQFRYERPQKGRLRSFYQFNVDILGEPGVGADAELIACLIESLRLFGLESNDFKIRLSDRKLWVFFLQSWGIAEAELPSVLSVMDRIEKMDKSAVFDQLKPYFSDDAHAFLESVKSFLEISSYQQLEPFFSQLKGSVSHISGINERISELGSLNSLIADMGLSDYVVIDFKVVRGLAYYTGFVFEAFEFSGKGRALAGGGRYDDLIDRLTGNAMEAVGFAMGDVTLLDLLESKGKVPTLHQAPTVALIFSDDEAIPLALKDGQILRRSGYTVEYPLRKIGFSKQFKEVNQKGIPYAFIYGSDELKENKVKLKNFKTGEESLIVREELMMIEALRTDS